MCNHRGGALRRLSAATHNTGSGWPFSRGGREAVTEYHVLEQFSHQTGPAAGNYTLVEAGPKTGRTHQLRVHFSSIGHPVVGDTIYGRRRTHLPVPRQFLHAWRLGFKHPSTGRRMNLETPLPSDLSTVLDLLRASLSTKT